MRVRVTPPAALEIEEILLGLMQEAPQAASGLARRIDAILLRLRDFPETGVKTSEDGVRRVNLSPYRYLILYEVHQGEVVVHAFRHGARHPDELKVFGR